MESLSVTPGRSNDPPRVSKRVSFTLEKRKNSAKQDSELGVALAADDTNSVSEMEDKLVVVESENRIVVPASTSTDNRSVKRAKQRQARRDQPSRKKFSTMQLEFGDLKPDETAGRFHEKKVM